MTDAERLPVDEQLALDDASFRAPARLPARALAVLPREARRDRRRRSGSTRSRELPLTEKHEVKATCTPEQPFGAHLCVGAIRARPHLLDERHDRHAQLHPADRERPGQLGHRIGAQLRGLRDRARRPRPHDVQRRPVRRRRRTRRIRADRRLSHSRSGPATASACCSRSNSCEPDAVVLTPSYAAYLLELADLRDSSVQRILVAGEPGGGEPAFRAALEEGWGARVTEAMGIGDIGPSLWGECEEQAGMHLGRARASCTPS